MDSSSSSDEDISLADMLAREKSQTSASQSSNGSKGAAAGDDGSSSSSEEETLADMLRASQSSASRKQEEDSSSEESDDEMSLADLKKKIEKNTTKKKRPASRSRTPSKKKRKSSSSKKKPDRFVAPTGQRRISRASGTLLKPQLVEAVLVRWNYCMDWPVLKGGLTQVPSKQGYLEMRAFEGVLVGISGDDTGKIIDYRDMTKAPTFTNLAKKDSRHLQSLAETAITKQISILEAADNVDNSLLVKGLRTELSDIMKVNPEKSDKQWAKRGW